MYIFQEHNQSVKGAGSRREPTLHRSVSGSKLFGKIDKQTAKVATSKEPRMVNTCTYKVSPNKIITHNFFGCSFLRNYFRM